MLEGNGSTPGLRAALQRQDAPRVYPAVVSVGDGDSAGPPDQRRDLPSGSGISEDWIVSRTGVRERPIAGPDERLTEYRRAGRRAGARARRRGPGGRRPRDRGDADPGRDPAERRSAGRATSWAPTGAGAVDVGAACTAFLSGVSLGASQIESGRARNVVVVGADFVISRVANWDDKRSAPLFGDGAGAVVLTPASGALRRDRADRARVRRLARQDDHRRPRDRRSTWTAPRSTATPSRGWASRRLAAVAQAGLTLEDIDLFVYHQANARITRALGDRLGLDPERVVDCIANLGNSSAATLPLALAEAERDGRLRPGARVLLGAFGAGFTWGAGVIEWGGGGEDG